MMFNFLGLQFSNLENKEWEGNNIFPAYQTEWCQTKRNSWKQFGNKPTHIYNYYYYRIVIIITYW